MKVLRCLIVIVDDAVVAVGSDEDEYYEVDDLEEMHTAIVNDDYEQVWYKFSEVLVLYTGRWFQRFCI